MCFIPFLVHFDLVVSENILVLYVSIRSDYSPPLILFLIIFCFYLIPPVYFIFSNSFFFSQYPFIALLTLSLHTSENALTLLLSLFSIGTLRWSYTFFLDPKYFFYAKKYKSRKPFSLVYDDFDILKPPVYSSFGLSTPECGFFGYCSVDRVKQLMFKCKII